MSASSPSMLARLWANPIVVMTVVLELCRGRYEGSASIGAVGSGAHRPSLTFRAALRIVWRDHRLRRLSLASFALIAAQLSLNSFLVTFLVREAGYGLAAAGSLLAAVQLGGLIGRLTWGAIAGRVVPAHTLVAMLGAGTMIGLALLGTFGTGMASGPLAVLCFFAGATAAGWNGVFLAEVARLAPAGEIARITGASFVLGSLGLLVGPLVFGAVARTWSFGLAYCVMAASALVGVAILLQGGPPRNERRPRSI